LQIKFPGKTNTLGRILGKKVYTAYFELTLS